MEYKFTDWLETQQKLDEVALPKQMQTNNLIHFDQKMDDFVYFGIHDLNRYFNAQGYLPNQLNIADVMKKSGRVIDGDPIKGTVKIKSSASPFHYGYRKLEDSKVRQKRRDRGDNSAEFSIPKYYLEKITDWLGTGAVLSGQNLWLAIDHKTQNQPAFYQEIQKHRLGKYQTPQPVPAQPDISNAEVDRARTFMMGSPQQAQVEPPKMNDLDRIFQPEPTPYQSPLAKFRMKNRQVEPFGMGESYDPSFMGHDRLWKSAQGRSKHVEYLD